MSTYTTKQCQSLRTDINSALAQRIDTTQQIDETKPMNASDKTNATDWWLLGTSGCHLCDQAQEMLRLFSGIYSIQYQVIDIADFDETLMMQFADKIPVLLTPSSAICYPFTLADLQQLLSSNHAADI